MSEISFIELVGLIVSNSIKISMEDDTWQELGYKKRPKYGRIVNRFRKEWKVSLENKLLTELIIIHISYGVRSYSESVDPYELIGGIIGFLDTNRYSYNVWESLNFSSNEEFLQYLNEGIISYHDVKNVEWLSQIMQRTDFKNIPDKKLQSKIIVGLADITNSLPERNIAITVV